MITRWRLPAEALSVTMRTRRHTEQGLSGVLATLVVGCPLFHVKRSSPLTMRAMR